MESKRHEYRMEFLVAKDSIITSLQLAIKRGELVQLLLANYVIKEVFSDD